jgi:hypothetical protein
MKDKLSIVQNFIIGSSLDPGRAPQWAKLDHIQSKEFGLPASAEVLGECKWVVNYKTSAHVNTIKSLYESCIPDLSFHNVLDGPDFHFAKHTLELLKEISTPYVFFLTEDRMFHLTNQNEFATLIEEISNLGVDWMTIGKLYKYIPKFKNSPTSVEHANVYTCLGKNSIHNGMVLDSIFKKEFLVDALKRIVNSSGENYHGYPWNVPHTLEKIPFWVSSELPETIIACPKTELIISDQDPIWKNGRLS